MTDPYVGPTYTVVDPYRDHLRTQTALLRQIRNALFLMLLVFGVAILAIIGASA